MPWLDVTGTGRIGVAGYLSCSLGCVLDPDDPVLKPVLERIRFACAAAAVVRMQAILRDVHRVYSRPIR